MIQEKSRSSFDYLKAAVTAERDLNVNPPQIIDVPVGGNNSTLLLDVDEKAEYAFKYIQNVGQNDLYIAVGDDACSAQNFHQVVSPGQQFDCTRFGYYKVYGFSVLGTSVATLVGNRNID